MKLTRRQLAAAILPAAVAVASAQQPAAQQPAAQQPPPQQPGATEELAAAARDRVKNTAAALAAVVVPMSTEPAFQFKA